MQHIAERTLDRLNLMLESAVSNDDSFLRGKLGLAYYYFNLYKAVEDQGFKVRAEALLESIFDNLNSGEPRLIGSSFGEGGAGLGYIMSWLNSQGLQSFDLDAEFGDLDEYLFNTASYQIEDDFIDFLHGALGTIHYFSLRKNTPVIAKYLDSLIGKLCARAVRKDTGLWFRNYVVQLEDKENINFGLAHGLSGILLILLNAYGRSEHKELIKKVTMEGIRFIRKYKMDIDFSNDEYSFFPFIVKQGANEIAAPSRLGWCYGDLNQVLLFYRAGRLFEDRELIDLADVIGAQTVMRKDARATLVTDSSFCHGASGLSEFYRSLHRERGLPVYLEGARYWTEQTILLLDKDLENGHYTGKEHQLLDGLVGVALPLISYISDVPLQWSRLLLL